VSLKNFKTFKEAIEVASSDLYIKVVVPDFATGLTKRTARAQLGYEELQVNNDSPTLFHGF
jgi:hypothetical protein